MSVPLETQRNSAISAVGAVKRHVKNILPQKNTNGLTMRWGNCIEVYITHSLVTSQPSDNLVSSPALSKLLTVNSDNVPWKFL